MNPKLRTAEFIINHTYGSQVFHPSDPVFESITQKTTNYTPLPLNSNVSNCYHRNTKGPRTPKDRNHATPCAPTIFRAPKDPDRTHSHPPPPPQKKNKTNKQTNKQQEPQITDFTNFLLKKELLLSRLIKFSDRAKNYRVWKVSFKSIVTKLKVTPFEELDLLVKWLGVDSSRQATNIRASNMNNP